MNPDIKALAIKDLEKVLRRMRDITRPCNGCGKPFYNIIRMRTLCPSCKPVEPMERNALLNKINRIERTVEWRYDNPDDFTTPKGYSSVFEELEHLHMLHAAIRTYIPHISQLHRCHNENAARRDHRKQVNATM